MGKDKQGMHKEQRPEAKRIEVLRAYALWGNMRAVSREQDVPPSTVALWVSKYPELVEQFREEYTASIAEQFKEEVGAFKDRIGPEVEKAIIRLLDDIVSGRWGVRVPLRDKTYSVKLLFDVHQLLEGEPTIIGKALAEFLEAYKE